METLLYVWISACLSYWSDGTGPLTGHKYIPPFLPPPQSQLRSTNGVNRFDSKVLSERMRFPAVSMVFLTRIYPVVIAGGQHGAGEGVTPSKPFGSSGAQAYQSLVSL